MMGLDFTSSLARTLLLLTATTTLPSRTTKSAQIYSTRFDDVTWDNTNWLLTTTTLDQGHYQARMSLANGYIGINLAAAGPFFEIDTPVNGDVISGWPLFNRRQTFATVSGFWNSQPTTNGSNFPWLYQYGGESVISGVPHWAGLTVQVGDDVLDASVPAQQISNFSSTMDFKSGVLTWNYTWTPSSASSGISVEYAMLVHKLYVNQAAVQLRLTAVDDTSVTVTDVLEGDCAVRSDFVDSGFVDFEQMIFSAVNPSGISNVTAYIYSKLTGDGDGISTTIVQTNNTGNASSIAQSAKVSLKAGTTSIITKYIGGASTDAFSDPQTVASNASLLGASAGFDSLLASHTAEWASILTEDSVDDYSFFENGTLPDDPYIIEQQITSVTNPFQLLQNTVGKNAITAAGNNSQLNVNSISVGGLGSDSYAGLVFWDADIWMSSGLVVSFPQAAKTIADYRARLFPQAQQNVKTAFTSSQNAQGKFTSLGAVYPWTSGRFGNCTGTGPCFDYEYHINGDIGLDLVNWYAVTGDKQTFEEDYFPVYDAISTFYGELVSLNESSGKYVLTNATDPDEYANNVDNPGYTMALIKTHIETGNTLRNTFGQQNSTTATHAAENIDIPVFTDEDVQLILEYATMNGSISVKQADIVLIDDFLDYPNEYTLSDLDYYAGKQSPNGPGMTYGVFSIVANAFSPSGCSSYTYGVYASHPYVRAPWFQYSEQLIDDYTTNGGTHPAYPFLTGMGGANRVAVFGYLGLKLRFDALHIDPSLPPQISDIRYRTFYWQGHAITASSNRTHTTLQRVPGKNLSTANTTYTNANIPVIIPLGTDTRNYVKYELRASGDSITTTNRQIGNIKTWAGNVAQCRPVTSDRDFEPGQFPFAANDGAVSTKWQPAQANVSSSITIDLGENVAGQTITGLWFDWGQVPPVNYSITGYNDSSEQSLGGRYFGEVAISNPYEPDAAASILPYQGNTTNFTFPDDTNVHFTTTRYMVLTIWGNQAGGDEGATVAEVGIIVNSTGIDSGGNGTGGSGGGTGTGSSAGGGSLAIGQRVDVRILAMALAGGFTLIFFL